MAIKKSFRNKKEKKKKKREAMLQGKRNKDCDITTNWDDAHYWITPLCFMRSYVQRFAIGPKLASHTAGPKNPMHADHINPVITIVFDMSLSCRCNQKILRG